MTGFSDLSANVRGAVWMVLGMFAYTANDTILKVISDDVGLFQVVFFRSIVLAVGFWLIASRRGELRPTATTRSWPLAIRIMAELLLTIIFLTALPVLTIGSITAILQSVPLAITLAAAVFLRESVGAARWLAIALGFLGVLLVVRPGADDFSWYSLLLVAAVFLVVIRDLATRRVDTGLPSVFLALCTAVAAGIMTGIVSVVQGWSAPTVPMILVIVGAAAFLGAGYTCSILTMRTGDVSFTAPFRYAVMVFALLIDVVVFRDQPPVLTLVGCGLIVAAGLWSLLTAGTSARASGDIAEAPDLVPSPQLGRRKS